MLDGISNPSFDDFQYYFLLNVVGIRKFVYALLTLESQIFSVIGVLVYDKFFKDFEVRNIIFVNVGLTIVLAFLFDGEALRWNLNWHIGDTFMLFTLFALQGAIRMAFQALPILALFVKVTPRKIEGTTYAFLTSTWNLDEGIIQPSIGSEINWEYVGVNENDQSQYPTLMFIKLLTTPLGFSLLPFIPLMKDIKRIKVDRFKK